MLAFGNECRGINMIVKFKKLVSTHEYDLVTILGKRKKDYIGRTGKVVHISSDPKVGNVYSVKFSDGQLFALLREQFDVLEG